MVKWWDVTRCVNEMNVQSKINDDDVDRWLGPYDKIMIDCVAHCKLLIAKFGYCEKRAYPIEAVDSQ